MPQAFLVAKTEKGFNALHLAAMHGHKLVVSELVTRMTSDEVSEKTHDNRSALDLVDAENFNDLLLLLGPATVNSSPSVSASVAGTKRTVKKLRNGSFLPPAPESAGRSETPGGPESAACAPVSAGAAPIQRKGIRLENRKMGRSAPESAAAGDHKSGVGTPTSPQEPSEHRREAPTLIPQSPSLLRTKSVEVLGQEGERGRPQLHNINLLTRNDGLVSRLSPDVQEFLKRADGNAVRHLPTPPLS
jgi:hypothetical protein